MIHRLTLNAFAIGFVTLMSLGCQRPLAEQSPDYARELAPGQPALRLVQGAARERVLQTTASQLSEPAFIEALDRSVRWFDLPSVAQHFPKQNISYEQAKASVQALQEIMAIPNPTARAAELSSRFAVYESVGYDGSGTVLFTGYYSPVFEASRTPTPRFRFPLYKRPGDLITDPATGQVLGRATALGYDPYPTRQQIERHQLLSGNELVYLPTRLDAYTIEVNGSAKLNMIDGSTIYVGYAGTNGRAYTSIGKELVADGKLDKNTVSMPTIRRYFQQYPGELDQYIQRNERFVFFTEYPDTDWPAGSLGFKVTPERTVATDKSIFPRGGVVVASTVMPDGQAFDQLMMDQDTGGAIRAPGRADLYLGIGSEAERTAGRLAAEGRLYYLLLKR
jgi:membrane-bound lytic murein transglycosylase A